MAKNKIIKEKTSQLGKIPRAKIKIIGIGGGGNSIVSEISKNKNLKGIDFIAINTDLQALKKVAKECKILQIGQSLTDGLGCGMNPNIGEKAAREEKEKIKKALEGTDFCILISCLGGGMGSGASPVIAEIIRSLKKISLGIFTLPFNFEGEKKKIIAKNSLKKMEMNLNAVNIIPNEKIFQIVDESVSITNALSFVNHYLVFYLEGLSEMIYKPGLINIDWADFITILEGKRKMCYLNRIEAQGENRASIAVKSVIQGPLNEYNLQGADRILFNIENEGDLKMTEVDQISKTIFNFNKKAKIIFGVSSLTVKEKSKTDGKIGITLLSVEEKKVFRPVKKDIPQEKSKKDTENKKPKKKSLKPKEEKKSPEPQEENLEVEKPRKTERKNAITLKKEIKKEEREILEKERKWDFPAFLRKEEDV